MINPNFTKNIEQQQQELHSNENININTAIEYVHNEISALFPHAHHNKVESFIDMAERNKVKEQEQELLSQLTEFSYHLDTHHFFKVAVKNSVANFNFESLFNFRCTDDFNNLSVTYNDNFFASMQKYFAILNKHKVGDCFIQTKATFLMYLQLNVRPIHFCKKDDKHAFVIIGDYQKNPNQAWIHDPHGQEYYPFNEMHSKGHAISRYLTIDDTFSCASTLNECIPKEFQKHVIELKPTLFTSTNKEQDKKHIIKNEEFWKQEIAMLYKAGQNAYNATDFAKAASYFQKYLTLYAHMHGEYSYNMLNAFFSLGSAFYGNKQYNMAYNCYDFAKMISRIQMSLKDGNQMFASIYGDIQDRTVTNKQISNDLVKIRYFAALMKYKLAENAEALEIINDALLFASQNQVTKQDCIYLEKAKTLQADLNKITSKDKPKTQYKNKMY